MSLCKKRYNEYIIKIYYKKLYFIINNYKIIICNMKYYKNKMLY